jgi:hypothetical protein
VNSNIALQQLPRVRDFCDNRPCHAYHGSHGVAAHPQYRSRGAPQPPHDELVEALFAHREGKVDEQPPVPLTIQTDALNRGVYYLDYPDQDGDMCGDIDYTKPGVLLLTYTWGNETLYTGDSKKKRYKLFYEALANAQSIPCHGDSNKLATIKDFVDCLPTPGRVNEDDLFIVD